MEKQKGKYTDYPIQQVLKWNAAKKLVISRLEIIQDDLSAESDRKIIQSISGRIKSEQSVAAKLKKKGYHASVFEAEEYLNDIVGVRAVCLFEDDLYRILDALLYSQDIRIVKIKDYIKKEFP